MKKTIHRVILIHIPIFLLIALFYIKLDIANSRIAPENNDIQVTIDTNNESNEGIDIIELRESIEKSINKNSLKEDKSQNINSENQTEIGKINNGEENKIIEKNIPEYKNKIEIAFLGDVMIGSRVGDAMDKNGPDYVYGGTKDYLSQRDGVILNLETSVTNREEKINKTYTFKAKSEYLEGLKEFNKNLVANLANNHIGDYKSEGIVDTINNLKNNDIEYFGAGNNKNEADSVKIITIEGVKIGLIGQTCVNPISFGATDIKAGNSRFDKEVILQEIKISHENNVDIIVYNMHCGIEYTNGPNQEQKEFAYFAIDNGADLVIGHHPHWYQPVEIYKEKLIFYSLGDYIFDIFRGRRTQEGIIANIIIENKKIIGAEILPTYTQSYGNTILSNTQRKDFALNELYQISKKLGEIEGIKEGYIDLKKNN